MSFFAIALAVLPQMVSIPAGSYVPLYGQPGMRVEVRAFKLDREPVTEAELRGGNARRPATHVTIAQARAYCSAQGKRLPTTDEWEYVAAATPSMRNARSDSRFKQVLLELYTHKKNDPHLGDGFVNAYGVADMHGVVWEWTETPPSPMHHNHGKHDMGCASSAAGATDTQDFAGFLRYAFRNGLTPNTSLATLGFRCAM